MCRAQGEIVSTKRTRLSLRQPTIRYLVDGCEYFVTPKSAAKYYRIGQKVAVFCNKKNPEKVVMWFLKSSYIGLSIMSLAITCLALIIMILG